MTSLLKALIFTCAISMVVGTAIDLAKKSTVDCTEPQRLTCLAQCEIGLSAGGKKDLDCPEEADCIPCYIAIKKEFQEIGEKVKKFKSMSRRNLSKDNTEIQERRRAITEAFNQAEKEGISQEDMLKRVNEIVQTHGGKTMGKAYRVSISWG